jgi:hypothetical protein
MVAVPESSLVYTDMTRLVARTRLFAIAQAQGRIGYRFATHLVGALGINTIFVVSKPPHEENGVWKMTVDEVELTKQVR